MINNQGFESKLLVQKFSNDKDTPKERLETGSCSKFFPIKIKPERFKRRSSSNYSSNPSLNSVRRLINSEGSLNSELTMKSPSMSVEAASSGREIPL